MKNEITIPVLIPEQNGKDLAAAAEHRKKYSLKRDSQNADFNRAIVLRLEKDKEKLEAEQSEDQILD
jgi:hypothetical protein